MTDTPPETPTAENTAAAGSDVATLQADLAAAQAKAAENLDGWQRERATFANYKRRMEKEQSEMREAAAARVINRYLDVQDDFTRAMKDQPTEGDAVQWAAGIALIYKKLQGILDSEGVKVLEAEGQPFDPNLHEAVTQEDSDQYPSGHVMQVLRPGYKVGDKVIRPAMVKVAK